MIKLCKTKNDILDSYIIRKIVFIDEQNVSYEEEFDLLDKDFHCYLYLLNQKPIATARYNINQKTAKIGRVCVLKEYRSQGIGLELINKIITDIFTNDDVFEIILDAQVDVISFYEKLGFVPYGDVFLDANIEHRKMILKRR